jgi:hypothetical protein
MITEQSFHNPPSRNNGGYLSLSSCRDCGAIGLRRDCHPTDPCYWCGGEVDDELSGKWVKPVTKWFGLVIVEEGFYIGRDGKRL